MRIEEVEPSKEASVGLANALVRRRARGGAIERAAIVALALGGEGARHDIVGVREELQRYRAQAIARDTAVVITHARRYRRRVPHIEALVQAGLESEIPVAVSGEC